MSQTNLPQVLAALEKKNSFKPFRLEEYLFDKQLAFVKDPSPFKEATTTRRAGKSTSCVADLSDTCNQNDSIICLYITLSRSNAKRLVWPEFKRLNRQYKLGGRVNESELSIAYPNGSILYLCGASDRKEIEKFRGLAIKKAYLDESQSFPAYIKDLIDDVIGPALMDHDGTLCLIGTPGPIPAGYFYDITRSKEWAHHFWTFFDNPHIAAKSGKTHQELLDRELKRRGVTADDPSIQREWFGRWVLDTNALVYRYSEDKQDYDALPMGPQWQYILGIDLGYEDADALSVLAWSPQSANTYLVEEAIVRHQGIHELTELIAGLKSRYDIYKIVVDTGGLGKKIAEELTRRYKIAIEPAEKVRKAEFIELMNDAMRTGKLKAKKDSRFAQDCYKVEWDLDKSKPDKKVISNRFHSDICESVLYAWRASYAYTFQPDKPKPQRGTPEWLNALEEAALEHFKKLEEADEYDPFKDYK